MKYSRQIQNQIHSFTFLELLVATTVLSALTVLILPALSDANAKFRAEYCINNLKQWGVGFQLYAADWNGWLPAEGSLAGACGANRGTWFNGVPPYLKMSPYTDLPHGGSFPPLAQARIWICPEKNLRNARSVSGLNSASYGMNNWLDGNVIDDCNQHLRHVRLSSLSNAVVTVLLCDVYANNVNCDPTDTTFQTYPWQKNGVGLHENGANFLFVDGHVSWFLVSAYWNGSSGIMTNPALRWQP